MKTPRPPRLKSGQARSGGEYIFKTKIRIEWEIDFKNCKSQSPFLLKNKRTEKSENQPTDSSAKKVPRSGVRGLETRGKQNKSKIT